MIVGQEEANRHQDSSFGCVQKAIVISYCFKSLTSCDPVFHVFRPSLGMGLAREGGLWASALTGQRHGTALERRIRTRSIRRLHSSSQPSRPRPQSHRSHCAVDAPLAVSHDPGATPWRAALRGRLAADAPPARFVRQPPTPCSRKRCAHLYTKRRLIPTMAAMAVIGTPSATSKIILPRLARPSGRSWPAATLAASGVPQA